MLNFFKRIRRKLIVEGNLKRYLLYATGEIILVVLGILIALQINNLNESRKEKTFEKRILIEIKSSLERDLELTNTLLNERIERKEQSIKKLLKIVALNKIEYDSSLLQKDFRKISNNVHFLYDDGPYESLKSVGLDKIGNDSLRGLLVKLYEVTFPRISNLVDHQRGTFEKKRHTYVESLVTYELVSELTKDTSIFVEKKTDLKTLQTNPDFIKLIDLEQNVALIYRAGLQWAVYDIENMIVQIDSELNR